MLDKSEFSSQMSEETQSVQHTISKVKSSVARQSQNNKGDKKESETKVTHEIVRHTERADQINLQASDENQKETQSESNEVIKIVQKQRQKIG